MCLRNCFPAYFYICTFVCLQKDRFIDNSIVRTFEVVKPKTVILFHHTKSTVMTNDSHPDSSRFWETYLRKRDTSQFSRRFSEIGIEPDFILNIRRILSSGYRPPCCVRDFINNVLEQFFKDNEEILKEKM